MEREDFPLVSLAFLHSPSKTELNLNDLKTFFPRLLITYQQSIFHELKDLVDKRPYSVPICQLTLLECFRIVFCVTKFHEMCFVH